MRIVETIAVGALLASAALFAYGPVPTDAEWQAAAFFTAFGILASALAYKTSSATGGTIGFLPFLSVAVIAPNGAAVVAVALSVLGGELIARRPPLKAVFNVSQFVFAEVVAIAIYLALGGRSLLEANPPIGAFVAMVAVGLVLNKLAVSTVVAVSSGRETREHWTRSMQMSAAYDLLAIPLIFFFALVYVKAGPLLSSGLALPLLGIRQLYKTNVALEKINEELLQLMVAAIEARDPYTSGHSQRVARYARVIARSAGIGARATERVAVAALLHDVGKIHEEFAPILRKPGRLTDEEFTVMKSHSDRGATLVAKVSHFEDLVPMIRAHHEMWDGRGYPRQIAGHDIPIGARIIALADTIDAMTTSRPYRAAMGEAEVRLELEREAGRQFDPIIVRALTSDIAWRQICREVEVAASEHPVSPEIERLLREISPLRSSGASA